MSSISSVFPKRPIQVLKTYVFNPPVWAFIVIFIIAAGLLFMSAKDVPSLVQDYGLKEKGVMTSSFNIVSGECRIKNNLVYTCDARVAYVFDGKGYKLHSNFSYITTDSSLKTGLYVNPNNPEQAQLSLAIDNYSNRIFLMLGFVSLGILGVIWAIHTTFIVPSRIRRLVGQDLVYEPVEVNNVKIETVMRKEVYILTAKVGGKKKKARFRFPDDVGPFKLKSNNLLAIYNKEHDALIVLDNDLSNVSLTSGEKAAVVATQSGVENQF